LNGLLFWPKAISSNGELVSLYTMEELLNWAATDKVSAKLAKIIEGLDDLDNPVVAIAK